MHDKTFAVTVTVLANENHKGYSMDLNINAKSEALANAKVQSAMPDVLILMTTQVIGSRRSPAGPLAAPTASPALMGKWHTARS